MFMEGTIVLSIGAMFLYFHTFVHSQLSKVVSRLTCRNVSCLQCDLILKLSFRSGAPALLFSINAALVSTKDCIDGCK
jgi:hypothetical protein